MTGLDEENLFLPPLKTPDMVDEAEHMLEVIERKIETNWQ